MAMTQSSSLAIEDYKALIKHFINLTEINSKLPLIYHIDNLDMIIFKIKACMFKSEKAIEILKNTHPMQLNFYDVIFELKQNIINNNKKMDSMEKYKIESSIFYLDNNHNDYQTNKKNYNDMIHLVREIIKIIAPKCTGYEIPQELMYDNDL